MLKTVYLLVCAIKYITDKLTVNSLCSRLGLDGMKMQVGICLCLMLVNSAQLYRCSSSSFKAVES